MIAITAILCRVSFRFVALALHVFSLRELVPPCGACATESKVPQARCDRRGPATLAAMAVLGEGRQAGAACGQRG